ncbi:unnamed protein product, partial [Brenthis ino]
MNLNSTSHKIFKYYVYGTDQDDTEGSSSCTPIPSRTRRSLNSRLSSSEAYTSLTTTEESSDSDVPVSPVKTSKFKRFINGLFSKKSKKNAAFKENKSNCWLPKLASFDTITNKLNGKKSCKTSDPTQLLLELVTKSINENNKNSNTQSKGKKSNGIPIKGQKNEQLSNGEKFENKNDKQKQLHNTPQDSMTSSSDSIFLFNKKPPVPGCSFYPTGARQTQRKWRVINN